MEAGRQAGKQARNQEESRKTNKRTKDIDALTENGKKESKVSETFTFVTAFVRV